MDLENNPAKEKPKSQENNRELLKSMFTEMVALGFYDASDYFIYLNEQTHKVLNPKGNYACEISFAKYLL